MNLFKNKNIDTINNETTKPSLISDDLNRVCSANPRFFIITIFIACKF